MKLIVDRLSKKIKNIYHWASPLTWSIAVKIPVVLLVASLVPMTTIAYYNLRQSLISVRITEYQNLELLASITANRLDQLITDTQQLAILVSLDNDLLTFLSSPPQERQALLPAVQKMLNNVNKSNTDTSSVLILDTTGLCLTSTNPENINNNYAFRDYFQGAMQGKPFVSDILIGSTTKLPGLYFSVPVRNSDKEIIGVLVIKLQEDLIKKIVNNAELGENNYGFLIDNYGIVISHYDESLLYKSLTNLSAENLEKSKFFNRFIAAKLPKPTSLNLPYLAEKMIKATKSGHTLYKKKSESNYKIIGFSPLKTKPWVVGVEKSEENFAAPLHKLARQTNLSVFVVGGSVTILALLFAKTIVKPVQSLTSAAKKLEKGNFDIPEVKVWGKDEVATLANAFNTMAAGLRDRQRERDIFGRVVSPEVREQLLKGTLQLGGETRRCSVLFSDIRGFSTLSEQMTPQSVVSLLNEYLTEMTDAVRPWGGYINNFIGDAILVIFGAPVDYEDKELRAVMAAKAMCDRLSALNQKRIARGEIPIKTGIGISTGEVVVGQIGSLERLLYTVIGDAVNIASRLETLTKQYPYHILINGATAESIKNYQDVLLKPLGLLEVKGRIEPVDVYAVLEESELNQDNIVQTENIEIQ